MIQCLTVYQTFPVPFHFYKKFHLEAYYLNLSQLSAIKSPGDMAFYDAYFSSVRSFT